MDTKESSHCSATEEDISNKETWCLTRVGKDSEWLRLFENTEVTIGRGLNVTHQLVSADFPLMISRLHCLFKQTDENGQWTVTDKRSLNGVFVNGDRIPVEKAYQLNQGDLIQVGVPVVTGSKVEFEYTLVRLPIKDIRPHLTKGPSEGGGSASRCKKTKRKFNADELEPSTSSKSKLYRHSASDKSLAQPCPTDGCPERPGPRVKDEAGPRVKDEAGPRVKNEAGSRVGYEAGPRVGDEAGPSVQRGGRQSPPGGPSSTGGDQPGQQRLSENMQALRERMDDTQRRVMALEGEQRQDDPGREGQVRELQAQLEVLKAQMHKMEVLERSISETEKRLEVQKTQQQEELMKKQLEEALLEQRKVIAELALSRRGFEEVLLAKDKELEVTKEEKERARAQKEEVVSQMTDVLENELQCIICSELFIQAVTLNCAHSFCLHCIREWRKRKDECPICRQTIQSQSRSLVLDNCIDRMVDNLSPDMKERRQALIGERKAARPEEVIPIHDVNSSSSSSDSSMDSSSNLSSGYSHWGSSPYYISDDDDDDDDLVLY